MSDILYSKLRLYVPAALDGENATITSARGATRTVEMTSPITDIMLAGMERYRVQAGITDEEVTFGYGQIKKLEITNVPANLEDASWSLIQELIQAGTFGNHYSVHDTKSFVIDGKTFYAEVVAINNGNDDASQWYPSKTVDFICKELYTSSKFNSSNTNNGGFPSSSLRTYLNNSLYPNLPTDLKDIIIEKSHLYQAGRYSSGSYSWVSSMVNSSDKLWLPTYYEIYGGGNTYAPGEDYLNNKPYYLSSKKKNYGGSSSYSEWWLGTPYTMGDKNLWIVREDGTINNMTATSLYGTPICFRIG